MTLADMWYSRPFLTILLFAVAIVLDFLIAKCFFDVAEEKHFYEKRYFWICALLPLIGYLLVIALPDRRDVY